MLFEVEVHKSGKILIAADSAHEAMEKAANAADDDVRWFSSMHTVSAELLNEMK